MLMDNLLTIAIAAWSGLLTVFISVLGYIVNEKFSKIKELDDKLNTTRVEVAREHITREEVTRITDHIDARFNRLESKIDQLIQSKITNA
jgi:predicted Holliday junction resolvase-like endonuclease